VSNQVNRLVLATTAAAVIAIAAAFVLFPVRPQIGGATGIAYWIALTLLASAMPVVLPRGTVVSVSAAPILASMFLGGPFAGALVALIGTVEPREVRGHVPWYGTLFNHAAIVVAVVLGGALLEMARAISPAEPVVASVYELVAFILACAVLYGVNWSLAVTAVSVRTGVPARTVWAQDISGVAVNLVGLAPVAWLMAQIFQLPNGVGWWATPLFVVPLFTTRLAYARYVETRELFEQTIEALAKAIDARDEYTRHHSSRVSHIAEAMCRVLRLPETEIEKIKWAGYLHDVGKIGIRDHILLKEGPLDKRERILMNQHPTIGARIVEPASQLKNEAPLILAHHEWFNGSGYPNGIEALDIPLGARVLAVADAYEAMTSARPYRKTPLTHEQAVDQLQKFAGIQFDPDMVPILVNLDRSILEWRPDTEERGPTTLERDEEDIIAAAAEAPRPSRPALASDDVS
jgi:putative nucleotidyltransferase with HDIG domain